MQLLINYNDNLVKLFYFLTYLLFSYKNLCNRGSVILEIIKWVAGSVCVYNMLRVPRRLVN